MQKSALELSLVCALYIMTSIPHWNPRLPRFCCSFLPILSCTRVIVGCVVECLVATVIRGQNIILSGVTRALATWSELWVWCPSSYQHQKCRLLKKKGEKCCLLQRREKHVTRGGPPSLSLVRLLIILLLFYTLLTLLLHQLVPCNYHFLFCLSVSAFSATVIQFNCSLLYLNNLKNIWLS